MFCEATDSLPTAITVDVEEWFHLLECAATPPFESWNSLSQRLPRSMELTLSLLRECSTKATFFWLGWAAQRYPNLVRMCREEGHEVASHGYGHVIAHEVGQRKFRDDVVRAKEIIEDLVGAPVLGFRAPGFGIRSDCLWAFDEIKKAGHLYDSSVFPAAHAHGGLPMASTTPFHIQTIEGPLLEFPVSVLTLLGRRLSMFGGGYLRACPLPVIKWGAARLKSRGGQLVLYVHPRELDDQSPRLRLGPKRSFRTYVEVGSTKKKLATLLTSYDFRPLSSYMVP